VHLTSTDLLAGLPPDTALVDGRLEAGVRLATGGYQQIGVSDMTRPAIGGSSTQVRAINSGFHLEAAVTPARVGAGEPFTLTVRVTNDAGSVMQEVNSSVTVEVKNSSQTGPGHGTLPQHAVPAAPGPALGERDLHLRRAIVLVVRDDAGNAPGSPACSR